MPRERRQSGFTILELLVVIAIIGILASVILASLSSSREKARNAQVLSQMDEYVKALALYDLQHNGIPHNWTGSNRARVACFGDGLTNEDCLDNVSFGSAHNAGYSDNIENALLAHISSLPRHTIGAYSGPAFSGCVSNGPSYFHTNNHSCAMTDYSIWFLLEGTNQDCGAAHLVYGDFRNAGIATLCRLQNN